MNTVEDRLSAALHARADLVQPEDLRAPELPGSESARGLRPWTYAALAAACAAAIVVPVTVWQTRDDGSPVTGPDEGLDWPLSEDRVEHDVDGDGRADHLTLRVLEADFAPARLDVELSGGGSVHRIFRDEGTVSWSLSDRVDLDGDGDDEILLSYESRGSGPIEPYALRLSDGQLTDVPNDDAAPLTQGSDEEMHLLSWWVGPDLSLYSSRSLEPFGADGAGPQSYRVQVWSWSLTDGGLRSAQLPQPWCVDKRLGGPPYPETCLPSGRDLLEEVTRTIGVGEFASLGDPIPTISLEEEANGSIRFAYSLSGVQFSATPPYATRTTKAYVATINLGADFGFLLEYESGGMSVYVRAEQGMKLVELPLVADIPMLGRGEQAERQFYTWISSDGYLYTREDLAPTDNRYRVWRWSAFDGALVVEELGVWCLDLAAQTGAHC